MVGAKIGRNQLSEELHYVSGMRTGGRVEAEHVVEACLERGVQFVEQVAVAYE